MRTPKPAGGTRNLGIPTVIDRVIQQRSCSGSSRSWTRHSARTATACGRDAPLARRWPQAYVIEGYRFVVDIDLAKFFDRLTTTG